MSYGTSLVKPTPAGDAGTWGPKVNAALDALDFAARPAPALGRLWAALCRVHDTPVRIVNIGDSNTFGSSLGASTQSTWRWTSLLARKLQRAMNEPNTSGIYFLAWDGDWTVTGTATSQVSQGLGANSAAIPNGTSISRTITADRFTVYYEGGSGAAGAFTVAIDGGAATTVTPSTGSISHSTGDVWVSPQLTLGSLTIVITATGASTVLDGVYCHAGDYAAGIQMINGGRYGATSTGPLTLTSFQRIKSLTPAVVTYQLLSNNFGVQGALNLYKQDVSNFVERVLSDNPNAVIVLINTHPRGGVGATYGISEQSYKDQMAAVAASRPQNVLFVDTGNMFRQVDPTVLAASSSVDPYSAVNGDNVHMTGIGHEMVAQALFHDVFQARWRGVQFPPAEVVVPTPLAELRASNLAGATDGQSITALPSSGSLSIAATAASGTAPIYKTGSLPTVRFASGQFMELDLGSANAADPLTVVTLHRADATMTGRGAVYNGDGGVFAQLDHLGGGTPSLSFGWNSLNQVTGITAPAAGSWILTAVVFAAGGVRHYVNRIVPNAVRTAAADGGAVQKFTLGATAAHTGSLFVGDLAYFGVWAGALTQVQVAEILKPLAALAAVTLTGEQTTTL
jgi:hypothetical protein